MNAPWSEVERLFELALAAPPAERAAVLAAACDDPALRREVESLLASDAQAAGFLEPTQPGVPRAPERVGRYRVLRKLGEGETSSVYLAVRDDDHYHQQVAIKLIRPGMDSRQILQRFHQERQILASLSHPHIARLLDGGSTSAGQPYFVMEYVDGEPLDVHCETAGLSLARRLALFCLVCEAVHAAHRSLVVHRDLKPGNILVDADGAPRLLDFGIAKLLDPDRVGVHVEPTATVARLMTPNYASPEQVRGRPISTASDVYSLGVILYKLVTGRRPYELGSQALHDIERVICESTPPPPSALLRGKRRVPRDLDNIALMAMRKQPERRYASAQELADDVRRCLARRPVLARRDTLGYRASSFARRNPGAVAAAAVVLLSILGGGVATTWQWRQAIAERTRAETQRTTAEQTLGFVVELFKVTDSPVAVHEITARELLERGAARLRDPARPPATVAALTHTLGVVYRNLGDYPRAARLLEEAVAAREAMAGSELELADSLFELGSIDSDHGKSRLANTLLQRALAIRTRLRGAEDLSVADVLERLARNVGYDIPVHDGEDYFRRALAIRRQHVGPDDPRLVASIAGLAGLYSFGGRYAEAARLFDEALAIRGRATGTTCRASDGELLSELAILRYREGDYRGAETTIDAALKCLQQALGPDHVTVVDNTITRIRAWCELGRYADAEALARHGLEVRRAWHGDASPAVDNALFHLAHVLYERDKLVEADAVATRSLAMRRRAYGDVHAAVARSWSGLGDIRLAGDDAIGAEEAYRAALASWPATLGADHPDIVEATRGLAEALAAQRRLTEATALARHALDVQRRSLRPGHPAIAATLVVLGAITQPPAAAEPMLREALAIWQRAVPPEHPSIARAESLLGHNLALQRRPGEAGPLLRRSVQTLSTQFGDAHHATRQARERLHARD